MKTWKSILVIAAVLAFANASFAVGPSIGVFFDEAATISTGTPTGGLGVIHTAYVCAVNCDMMVAGASFKLVLDPQITLMTTTYPEGLAVGEIATGVDMGMTNPVAAFASGAAVLATLQLTTFDNMMTDAPLTITNHPDYASPIVADSLAELHNASGLTSFLTVTVANENKSWSDVKNLFQ